MCFGLKSSVMEGFFYCLKMSNFVAKYNIIQKIMFVKGQSGNPKGKAKGTPNKLTKTVKETVLEAFQKLQESEDTNIVAFATKYPRDFYQIAAKLIPTDLKAEISGSQELVIKFEEQKTYETKNGIDTENAQ